MQFRRRGLLGALLCSMIAPSVHAGDANLASRVQDILKTHCYRCHGKAGAAKGGFKYVLDRDKLVQTKYLVPGKPAASEIFQIVRRGEMPPRKEKQRPSRNDLALLEQWIAAGAPAVPRPVRSGPFVSERELLRWILADLETVAPVERKFVRYLSLVHWHNAGLSGGDIETGQRGLAKLLNGLSWHPRVHVPHAVDPAKTVLRIDLRRLKWPARLWNRVLAFYPYRMSDLKGDAKAIMALIDSDIPYVRADWFVASASRAPLYHDLLDLPSTDRGLERLLQIDATKNIEELSVIRFGFNGSGVSTNNRLIERHDAAHGAYWKTYDFSANTDRQNLFKHPLGPPPAGNAFVHAGGEMIFHLPNGMLAFFLADGIGRRIDRAPVSIVSDPARPDKSVEAGLSCFTCHATGFLPKNDQVRAHVLKNSKAFTRRDLEIVKAIYPSGTGWRSLIAMDSRRYHQSLAKLGMKPTDTEPITAVTRRYESVVDLDTAAAETGFKPADFAERLGKSSGLSRSLGPFLTPGGTVQRQTFIEAFPDLIRSLQGRQTRSALGGSGQAFAGHTGTILAIAIAPDGSRALTANDDRPLRLWDVQTGRELGRFSGHRAAVTAVALSPDGSKAVSGSHDRTLRLWDVRTGKQLRVMAGHTDAVASVCFSPDSRRILSGSHDKTLRLWNTDTGRELRAFTGHAGRVSSVAFAPDGKLALSGSHDRTVRLWDVASGKSARVVGVLGGEVYTVAFAPDGKVVAAGGNDRVVRLWDVSSGRMLRRLEGHANAVIRVAFRPDSRTILSASSQYQSADRTIRIWDASSGREKRSFAGRKLDCVGCAAFAGDGSLALTGGHGSVLRRWPLQ